MGLRGADQGRITCWGWCFNGAARLFVQGAAGDGGGVVKLVAVEEALREDAGTAGLLVVLGGEFSAGLEVADEGGAGGDCVEVLHGEGDGELVRDGDEVEDGVGGAAGCGDGGDGVFNGLAGEDMGGFGAVADEVHDEAAGFAAGGGLVGRHGGDAGDVHGGDAEELAGHGHGVRGELAAAGAGAWAGGGFKGFELVIGDLAGGVRAHAFEDLEDGDFF